MEQFYHSILHFFPIFEILLQYKHGSYPKAVFFNETNRRNRQFFFRKNIIFKLKNIIYYARVHQTLKITGVITYENKNAENRDPSHY